MVGPYAALTSGSGRGVCVCVPKAPLEEGGLVEKYLLYVVTLTAPPLFPLAQIRHGEL